MGAPNLNGQWNPVKFRGLNWLETKGLSIERMRVAERDNEAAEPRDGWVRIEEDFIQN